MTTDTTLDAWVRWLTYSISKEENSVLAGIPIRLRDSEETKEYPGIYISEGSIQRVEAGGVMDGNVWGVEIVTELKTVPGEDGQLAVSRAAHDILRKSLSAHANNCRAKDYLDAQLGLTCFEVFTSSPETMDEDTHRVTRWGNEAVVCAHD